MGIIPNIIKVICILISVVPNIRTQNSLNRIIRIKNQILRFLVYRYFFFSFPFEALDLIFGEKKKLKEALKFLLKGEGLLVYLVVWKMMAIHAFSNRGVSMLKNCETSFFERKIRLCAP